MSKKAVEKPVRRRVTQPAEGNPVQATSGPPQFLVKAADASNAGDYDKAIDLLKQGVNQDSFAAYQGIGDMYLLRGENEKAIEWLEKARECRPESVAIVGSMGQALVSLGREEEAVREYSTAIQRQDEIAHVRMLVNSMWQMGLTEKAIGILEGMIEVNPQQSDVIFELARSFVRIGRLDKAEACYKQHVAIKPSYQANNELGLLCRRMGRISEAVEYMQRAVKLNPLFGGGWDNLAGLLMECGCTEKSIELSRIIVSDTSKDPHFHSNLIFRLHYSTELHPQTIFEEHKEWGQRYAPISMAKVSHDNVVDPSRKLRIGYISPDFKRHVAAGYIAVLLDSHNPEGVEVYGYGNVECPDETTANMQVEFDQYRDIWNVSDEAVARIIEQDKIDILVDLAGHTKNNRLLVFAFKPAPVQVTYLGYPDTTGMRAIDYMLTDNRLTPPNAQKFYTEELFPLPSGFCRYKPLQEAPAVNALPAVENGHVTFGAFTNVWRLNSRLLEIWSEILKCTDNSKLILGFRGGDDEGLQHRFLSQFEQCGISRERIELRGMKPYRTYLKQYNDVDIVLDTFPENGGTTTCDALWMGVPVISLVGQHQVGRYGLSVLSSVGLERFAATTALEYVTHVVSFANNPESLIEIRESMRSRMAESPLCDSKRFAHELESAYRDMWHRWCRRQGANAPTQVSRSRDYSTHNNEPRGRIAELTRTVCSRKTQPTGQAPQCPVHDRMRIAIAGDMPQCLVEANAAITRGQVETARYLVNDQAIEEVCQRLGKDPSRTDIMLLLAAVLNSTGQKREAYAWYQKCAEVEPNALIYNEIAMISGSRGLLTECIEYLRRAMAMDPEIPAIWVNLAVKLIEAKQLKEGFDLLRRAINKEPDNPVFYSIYLFSLNHLPDIDPQMIFGLHTHWGTTHAPISMAKTSHANTPVADRRLRIGYISPDFRGHSVAHFIEPLLDEHDHSEVEVYGYGNVASPDRVTERLKSTFDHYRNIFGLDDKTVAHMIEQDGIDILIELAGHTKLNCLLVLAHKPAPIQVTYLGYGDTTGVEAIDYILTDNRLSPPESQKFYTEQLMYLPGSLCYRLPDVDLAVTPPPSMKNKFVTFGSFCAHRRFNLHLLKHWADILRETPNSRMTLGFASGIHEHLRNHYLDELVKYGISRERVRINGPKPYIEYLKAYAKIDILLDTFPENGGTYTCESLWMGVPVITLAGPRQISRYGLSLLSSIGLESFVATTASDYVAKAVAFSNNPEHLIEMRQSMRARITSSPLCRAKEFAHEVESAYREMWHRWCRRQGASC